MDAVLMAAGDHLSQVLPVLLLVFERPATAPGDPDPVELRVLEQAEHLLKLAVISVGEHILLFGGELPTPPGPLGFPALDLSAVQPYETKTPLLGPWRYVFRLSAVQGRWWLKRLGGAKQEGGGDQTNQCSASYDGDTLHGFFPRNAHEQNADVGAVLDLIEKRVFSMQYRLLQCPLATSKSRVFFGLGYATDIPLAGKKS